MVAVLSYGFLLALAVRPARPPAWRALQNWPSELITTEGRLRGSPPCLQGLVKVGQGHSARWRVCSFNHSSAANEVYLKLDRNPDEPCLKLEFHTNGSLRADIGHMLLLAESPNTSALRGMRIAEAQRGRGLCKVLLAVWIRACLEAGIAPSTREINKPLLSLSLASLGFQPTNGRGQIVKLNAATRLRDCVRADGVERVSSRCAYVRTTFDAPDPATLAAAACEVLPDEALDWAASPRALRQALTLRGGSARMV